MKKYTGAALLLGGGALSLAGIFYGKKKMDEVTDSIEEGVDAPTVIIPPAPPNTPVPAEILAKLPTFQGKLTGYWPYQEGLSAEERKMEGGTNDRLGHPIITLEMHQNDPVNYPYVSVSGDYTIFPAGQRLVISTWPTLVFRVTDTGSHFHGINKVYRVMGAEPLDIAVNSSKTVVPHTPVSVKIVPGDTFAKKGLINVATGKLKNQTVTFTGEINEGYTIEDHEALARAIESEMGGRSKEEQLAAAWTVRNRANKAKTSIKKILAPRVYGSPLISKGYASTRKPASPAARIIASEVLGAEQNADPTQGATDFWVPSQQDKMRQLGDIYRAARKTGDIEKAVKYSRYAKYGTEGDVRTKQARQGLRVVNVIGSIELLKKI